MNITVMGNSAVNVIQVFLTALLWSNPSTEDFNIQMRDSLFSIGLVTKVGKSNDAFLFGASIFHQGFLIFVEASLLPLDHRLWLLLDWSTL